MLSLVGSAFNNCIQQFSATLFLIGSSFCFDCFDVCFHNYTTSSDNELNCELLLNARTCYNANVENCSSFQSRTTLHQVQLALDNNGCSIATSSVTTPTMTTMTDDTTSMISCPSVNTQSATLLVTNAVIWSEETVPSSCMVMESDLHLQHCRYGGRRDGGRGWEILYRRREIGR